MEILFNIKDLLEKSNQVILPGIGSFSTKRIEGFFDEEKKTFYPPKETIEFTTSEVKHHPNEKDVLLELISNSKNVSEASAVYILSKHIDEIRKDLEQNGEFSLQDIGKLKLHDSTIIFEAEDVEKYSNSFFGLPSFTIPSADENIVVEETEEKTSKFSLAEQALNASTYSEEFVEDEKPKSRFWLYILLSLIIIALSVSALYLYRPDIYNSIVTSINNININTKTKTEPLPTVTEEERESAIADSIYKNDVVKNLESGGFEVETVKDSADITINQKVVPNKNDIRYEIIIAAWHTREKAEDHVKKLRENGINANIVEDGGPMIKISTATLYNKTDADKELKRVREELNPEAFYKAFKNLK